MKKITKFLSTAFSLIAIMLISACSSDDNKGYSSNNAKEAIVKIVLNHEGIYDDFQEELKIMIETSDGKKVDLKGEWNEITKTSDYTTLYSRSGKPISSQTFITTAKISKVIISEYLSPHELHDRSDVLNTNIKVFADEKLIEELEHVTHYSNYSTFILPIEVK